MIHLNKISSKIEQQLVCEYSNIRPIGNRSILGYKLVYQGSGNYYSLVSGLFRYKLGPVDTMNNYHTIYEGTPYFCEDMIGRVAVFKSLNDLESFYPEYKDIDHAVVVTMEISNDLIALEATRNGVKVELVAGRNVKRMIRHHG